MGKIQLMIEMDDGMYQDIKNCHFEFARQIVVSFQASIAYAIRNGTPIPKYHGRLKDVDAFLSKAKADREHSAYSRIWTADDVLSALDNSYAPTIIEADGGERYEVSN